MDKGLVLQGRVVGPAELATDAPVEWLDHDDHGGKAGSGDEARAMGDALPLGSDDIEAASESLEWVIVIFRCLTMVVACTSFANC